MGTHPIFESDFDCLTECLGVIIKADPVLVLVALVSIRWVKISLFIQVQSVWEIHKVDHRLDQWDNKDILEQWAKVIRLVLVVEVQEDQLDHHKWDILVIQIIIKWLKIQIKWAKILKVK